MWTLTVDFLRAPYGSRAAALDEFRRAADARPADARPADTDEG